MLHFIDISKYFGNRLIFDQITCHIEMASFNYILGATGSGKTTFLELILQEKIPDNGQILFLQHPLEKLSTKALTQHRQHIGMVPQVHKFLRKETVETNLILPLKLKQEKKEICRTKANDFAEKLGLRYYLKYPIDTLSKGEQQLVAIARALIHEPLLILADDPTQHLSKKWSRVILNLLHEVHNQGTTVIITSPNTTLLTFDDAQTWILRSNRIHSI